MKEHQEINDLRHFVYIFKDLQKLSRKLRKIYENQCNGYKNENLEKMDLKKEEKLNKKVLELCESVGVKPYFQGDPRGCALYIGDNSINGSNYTNGIAVY